MLEEAARADPLKTWMLATLKKLINHEDEESVVSCMRLGPQADMT